MARLLKLCIAALLLVCIMELAARNLFFPQYTAMLPDMYAPHPVLGHFNKPNLTVRRYNPMNYDVINRTNQLGLRGGDDDSEKNLSGIWIAGASNTFGGFVEDNETYAAQLKRYGYHAANLASEGHGIVNQTLFIRLLAEQGYRPRAVILSITMYQAITDYDESYDTFTRPLGGQVQSEASNLPRARDNLRSGLESLVAAIPTSVQPIRARLLKSSALYGWSKVGIMGIPALREFTLRTGLRNDLYLVPNFDVNLLRPLTGANPSAPYVVSTAKYIAALQDLVTRQLDVPFGVVMLPSLQQINPESLSRFANYNGLQVEKLSADRAPDALQRTLKRLGVPVLDVLPHLMASGVERLHFPDDGHLTASAHAVVGKAVAEWLSVGLGRGSAVKPADTHSKGAAK